MLDIVLTGYPSERGDYLMPKSSKNSKTTSSEVASKASKILQDNRFSDKSKSVAGSALSQKTGKKK